MQNKKMIVGLGILIVLVGVAAFIGGRLLNQRVGPMGRGLPMGNGDIMSVSVQVTPAPELPTTQPAVIGSFVERKDKTIVIQSVSLDAGKGGGVVVQSGGGEGETVAGSPLDSSGPKVEVVINNETTIYIETTQMGGPPASGENVVLQQTVEEGSLDDLTAQSFVTVWGRKSGDRIIAEVILISNPIMFKRP